MTDPAPASADLDTAGLDSADVDTGDLDTSDDHDSTFALFEGDEGHLADPERRALVALLRHRYVSARSHPVEWRALLTAEHHLRSRLNDLFLELHIDHEREVAFKRQARSESTRRPFPTLLHDTAYTREETLVLVYLRMRLRADTRPGPDQVVVDRSEVLGHVAGFRPATATDRTRDEGRVAKAIDRLVTARILLRTTDPDRFRIASVVEVLLPLERLQELDRWLQTQTDTAAQTGAVTETDTAAQTGAVTETGLEARGGPAPSLPSDTVTVAGLEARGGSAPFLPSGAEHDDQGDPDAVPDDPTDAPLEGLDDRA